MSSANILSVAKRVKDALRGAWREYLRLVRDPKDPDVW